MKAKKKLLAVILALMASALIAGCSPEAVTGRNVTLGNIGWDENTVVANLTKIILEEDLGYDSVEIQQADVGPTFQGVATGDLDAFQDVWMPNHQEYMSEVEGRVERLSNWYTDTTRFGLAAPTYMGITSIPEINNTNLDTITGIEPGAVITNYIDDYTIPEYGLDVTQTNQSTAAMLAELDRRYQNEEPIVFPAWQPHWMNDSYDFVYLEDPQDTLYPLNRPSEVGSIVRQGFQDDYPAAYTLIDTIRLSEDDVVSVQRDIEAGYTPEEAVRNWIEDNRDRVDEWVEAARAAQE